MKYHQLEAKKQRSPKRVGRGISAGQGKTAGRGTKGQGARKSPVRAGFEGGQTPLAMRLPKLRGFKSHRTPAEVVYTGQLDLVKSVTIDTEALFKAKLISSPHVVVKLIAQGEVTGKHDVKLAGASAGAIEMVKKAGGSFTKTDRLARAAKVKTETEVK